MHCFDENPESEMLIAQVNKLLEKLYFVYDVRVAVEVWNSETEGLVMPYEKRNIAICRRFFKSASAQEAMAAGGYLSGSGGSALYHLCPDIARPHCGEYGVLRTYGASAQ